MPDQNIPFEVTYSRAKSRIVAAINQVANELQLPGPILAILLRDIVQENENSALSMVIASYELVQPEALAELKKAKETLDNMEKKSEDK